MAANTLKIEYFGTNVGKIYLRDCTKRLGLGGGQEGGYNIGQDQYIVWGQTIVLEVTDEVEFSMLQGVLKYFSTAASSTVFSGHNGAPLVLTEGSYTEADEWPRQDIGDTGSGLFTDTVMAKLANDQSGVTGAPASGETGYYYGNSDL